MAAESANSKTDIQDEDFGDRNEENIQMKWKTIKLM